MNYVSYKKNYITFHPPKNGEIAMWPNTRVVKWGVRQRGGCHACVCCFFLLNQYWGINERSRSFLTSEPREHVPTIENRRRTTSP